MCLVIVGLQRPGRTVAVLYGAGGGAVRRFLLQQSCVNAESGHEA